MFELVVTQDFATHAKGDVITEEDDMGAALESSPHCVVRRAVPADPAPAQPVEPAADVHA